MHFCFVDDSDQLHPAREGMGPLVALGGLVVPAEEVSPLERALGRLCAKVGFPKDEEFKWSPGRGLWMHEGLVDERRERFLLDVVRKLGSAGANVMVVIEDTAFKRATDPLATPDEDVTTMFIERLEHRLVAAGQDGVIVADRPGGGRGQERRFVRKIVSLLDVGTKFVKPERIVLNALLTDSKLVRLLQAADLVVGATTAFVAGHSRFAGPVFDEIRPLMFEDYGRVGGVGLKLHPDGAYANLYHWLLGDTHFVRYQMGVPFPLRSYPYAEGPDRR